MSSGAGRSDVLMLLKDTYEVVEAKVWRGPQYHGDGLIELATYARKEQLVRGYYVVFEFHKLDPITPDEESAEHENVTIDIVYIHMPLTAPSELGKERRRK